jgi:hypothetical protein
MKLAAVFLLPRAEPPAGEHGLFHNSRSGAEISNKQFLDN